MRFKSAARVRQDLPTALAFHAGDTVHTKRGKGIVKHVFPAAIHKNRQTTYAVHFPGKRLAFVFTEAELLQARYKIISTPLRSDGSKNASGSRKHLQKEILYCADPDGKNLGAVSPSVFCER